MAKWTQHTVFNFHCETNNDPDTVVSNLETMTGLATMGEQYHGVWKGKSSAGVRVTWIAGCDVANPDAPFAVINRALKVLTDNNCLMATRSTIDVFCECN